MFVFLLLCLPILIPIAATVIDDPAAGATRSKQESRALECQRVREETARDLYPGKIAEPSPRGDYIDTEVVVCEERLMQRGERRDREEAILAQLSSSSSDVVAAASAAAPELDGATWLVEAYYPDAEVAAKISFAAKTALMSRGRKVSDRVPILTAGDIMVLGRMQPRAAYPLACKRYHDEGEIGPGEVLLANVLLDGRETILHAGICTNGEWRWLR
jgi:hypothetical protein